MALCPKCIIEGLGSGGGGLMPADQYLRIEFSFVPDSDGDVEGERRVSFEGEISEGNPSEGGVSATGVLRGSFGIGADEEIEAPAVVETYTRDGSVVFAMLVVTSDAGRVTFSANLSPSRSDDADSFEALVFMGWPETPLTSS